MLMRTYHGKISAVENKTGKNISLLHHAKPLLNEATLKTTNFSYILVYCRIPISRIFSYILMYLFLVYSDIFSYTYFSSIHTYLNFANISSASTSITKLKKLHLL